MSQREEAEAEAEHASLSCKNGGIIFTDSRLSIFRCLHDSGGYRVFF